MTKPAENLANRIVSHPDVEEIIAKLMLGISAKDINAWLTAKYPSEKKFILAEKVVEQFRINYLDVYVLIRNDLIKTREAIKTNSVEELELTIQNSSAYKKTMLETANQELDIRSMIVRLCKALEFGFAKVFDDMYENPHLDIKAQRALNETADTLGNLLEKYYKFTENPADIVIQHNVSVQAVDQHIAVFHEAVRETLATLSVESSLLFTELLNKKLSKLKAPQNDAIMTTDMKMAEVKLLNETIGKKLNTN